MGKMFSCIKFGPPKKKFRKLKLKLSYHKFIKKLMTRFRKETKGGIIWIPLILFISTGMISQPIFTNHLSSMDMEKSPKNSRLCMTQAFWQFSETPSQLTTFPLQEIYQSIPQQEDSYYKKELRNPISTLTEQGEGMISSWQEEHSRISELLIK